MLPRAAGSIGPTRSNNSSSSLENGDSIPRRSGWSGVDSGKPRWTCLLPTSPPTASYITPFQVCVFPSESARTDTFQGQGGRGAGIAGCALLAHQDLVFETHAPHDSPSLAHPPETRLLSHSPETRPGYMPNVPTTPFRNQVVKLQALLSEEADPALALLCPVRALWIYVDRTQSFRSRKRRLSPSRGCPTGWWMPLSWRTNLRVSRAPWGESSLHTECYLYLFTHTLYINVIYISK